jgi:aspartate/methionine/tyrosine aminotransferase
VIEYSKKLQSLPPYLFSKINTLKLEAYAKKLDVIDLGMGNPDLPTPPHIVERMIETVREHPRTHRYPQAKGMPKYRAAVADWMERRFGVSVDPNKEVLGLIGSKEGIAHLCMAYLDPGDIALVGNPGYPVHFNGVYLAGGKVHYLPLDPDNGWLPDLSKVPEKVARKAKMLLINYPNNPTAAVVDTLDFFKEVVAFAKKYDILVVHDNAYSEITFDGYEAPSFLQVPGAKDVGVEFFSFSKTYNMAGWRVGFAVGGEKFVYPLEKLKSFLDYGTPSFVQLAAVWALKSSQDCVKELCKVYQKRRDFMCDGMNRMGWAIEKPKATMYLWAKLPEIFRKKGSLEFAERLLKETGVVVAPGVGFGPYGEGYVRMALVTHDKRFHDVLLRLKKFIRPPETKPKEKRRRPKASA